MITEGLKEAQERLQYVFGVFVCSCCLTSGHRRIEQPVEYGAFNDRFNG